jgi:hypothetical protein
MIMRRQVYLYFFITSQMHIRNSKKISQAQALKVQQLYDLPLYKKG